ncbi:MAG: 2-hydroxyacyl-CoA dehydratase [Dehalococcoidia bacterium]|nr:MAG: 2-hydroxyacyl-CoA dehydratase [Dehalococcoidia bacterium]
MTTKAKYEIRPLDCWQWGKELRMEAYRELTSGHERGKLLVLGCAASPYGLLAGLGDFVFLAGEPYGASVAADPPASIPAMEAYEARGYARDMCGYMRNFLGSMYLDKYYFTGGPFPKFDFIWSIRHCPAGHPKWHHLVSEYQGIPMTYIDDETWLTPDGDPQHRIEYVAGQYLESIEWMEKVTGRTYDDEKAIEAMRNYFHNEALWGEICLLNSAIPAPLDIKSYFALMPIPMLRRHEAVATQFLETLRDELKDRIANHIAAVPNERYRMCMMTPPPWSFLKIFRYLENFGVVFVGTYVYLINSGEVKFLFDEGKVIPAVAPEERPGWPQMKTREDLCRTIARWRAEHPFQSHMETRKKEMVILDKHWNAHGWLLLLNRGCVVMVAPMYDIQRHFQKHGIPVAMFEGNFADCRDMDETGVIDRLEAFLEGQGIQKLPEA